jgi:shikimate dehydrogenase
MKLGLFGFPLGHSFSKGIFKKIFSKNEPEQDSYQLFELEDPMDIIPKAEQAGLQGFNVTIPHKEIIIPFLNRIHKDAQIIKAVNVVKKVGSEWVGYNSDWVGFRQSMKGIEFSGRNALVLGSGGSSRAVSFALKKDEWTVDIVSREPSNSDLSYSELSHVDLSKFSLIVNCTPVGMAPNESQSPDFPHKNLPEGILLYDLIYNPERTQFLNRGNEFGARTKNGLEMLILQARESWRIWKL